ncbi:hypothetical protein DFS34DRAFT_605491 [Phlyctochytrium arcticum]|nr:hypothetical protein DFS34DRAFT_605491 [Phlyctochytrium arcticum]
MFSNSPHPSPTSTVQGSSSQSVFPAWPFSMMPSEAPEGYDDFHLQLLERDDFRCCLSGQVDMPSVQTRQTPYQYQERYGFLDAAYMFPFSLRHHMAYLSRLTYPQDLFRLLARGSAINDTQNGILLERGMHSKFGEMWCIHALNDIYTFVSLSVGGVDSPPDGIFNFRAPKPNPILVNIHGMFAAAKAAMEASGTWKADGERNLVDKEDESAGLASPAMDTLVLGDPAVI